MPVSSLYVAMYVIFTSFLWRGLNSPMGNSPSGRTIKVTTHHSRLIDEACNNQQTTIELICDNLFAVNMFAVVTAYKSFSLHDT